MRITWLTLLAFTPLFSLAQNVAINNDGSAPDPTALLDIKSSAKGLLIPRLSTAERTAILSPATGLTVFDITTTSYWMYRGDVNGGWAELQHQYQKLWDVNGSNIFNTNNGNVGIGTSLPGEKLAINGPNAAIQFMNSGSAKGFLQSNSNDIKLATYNNNTTGNLVFATRATDRMWIDENGLVGIGTATPNAALTVNGTDPLLQMRTGNVNKGYLQAMGNDLKLGTNSTNTTGSLVLHTRSIDRVWIDENGLVGIGTATPAALLTVNGTNPIIQLRNAGVDKGFIQLIGDDIKIGTNITNTNGRFFVRTNGADRLVVDQNGRVGIGVSGTFYQLEVNGTTRVSGDMIIDGEGSSSSFAISSATPELSFSESDLLSVNGGIKFEGGVFKIGKTFNGGSIVIDANTSTGTKRFYLNKANQFNFGSGIFATGYTLSVEGKVIATDFTTQAVSNWPDYVFAGDYRLRTLHEVEQYIQRHSHLPGIPPAAEVEQKGIQLGDMTKRLTEKVEELTLYILQLNKEIEALKKTQPSTACGN